MSKIKLLLDVVSDLRSLSESIQAVANAMANGEIDTVSQATEVNTNLETETEKPVKTIPLEEVRAVLAEKSRSGLTAEVRGLLEKYGAKKLSEINPADFSALLKDAEGL